MGAAPLANQGGEECSSRYCILSDGIKLMTIRTVTTQLRFDVPHVRLRVEGEHRLHAVSFGQVGDDQMIKIREIN